MIVHSFFLILTLISLGAHAHAPAEGKVYATIGPYLHQTHALRSFDTLNSPIQAGFGLFAEGDINNKGGAEVGVLYYPKTYQRVFSGSEHIVEKVFKIEVPIGYRYWPMDALSIGLFFSPAFSIGPYETVFDNVSNRQGSTTARDVTDYGGVLSIQWEAWSKDPYSLVLDGRYFYSFTAKASEDANVYGLFVGLKYVVQ